MDTLNRPLRRERLFVFLFLPVCVWVMFAFFKTGAVYVQYADVPVIEQGPPATIPSVVYIDHVAIPINPRRFNPRDPEKVHLSLDQLKQESNSIVVKAPPAKRVLTPYEKPALADSFWKEDPNPQFYFGFNINQPEYCQEDFAGDMLIIMVPTAPKNVDKRKKIRGTWGKKVEHRGFLVKTLFLLGQTADQPLNVKIKNEADTHKDIIQANFTDTYRNLTYKTLSGLNWVKEFCPRARAVIKMDDDVKTAVHVRLVKYIEGRMKSTDVIKQEVWCFGSAFNRPGPIRNEKSKWHAPPEIYPEKFYPMLCLGSYGYVITREAVSDIIAVSHRTKFFWLEDVYVTGILRQLANGMAIKTVPK